LVTLTLTRAGGLEPRAAGKGVHPSDWHGASFNPGARWFRARTDNLIIGRIDVWQGRAAIIPPEFDGALVAREFPLFQVREDKLRPYYLKLLLRAGYFQRAIRAITTGHANRRRTQDDGFEDLEIFLPGVDVQDRIVQVVQDRERAVRADTRDVDRLVGEVERCVRGELSADELLAAAGGSTSEDATAS
jgi:type I restriction enzyme M protein